VFRRLVQLDRVGVRIVEQDLPTTRAGLDRVTKMRMRFLERADRSVEILHVQDDAIPASRPLLGTVAHGTAARGVGTAEKKIQIAARDDKHGASALHQTESKLVRVEAQRAPQVGDLVADDRGVVVGYEYIGHVRTSVGDASETHKAVARSTGSGT
jgi:hypothetical protein